MTWLSDVLDGVMGVVAVTLLVIFAGGVAYGISCDVRRALANRRHERERVEARERLRVQREQRAAAEAAAQEARLAERRRIQRERDRLVAELDALLELPCAPDPKVRW